MTTAGALLAAAGCGAPDPTSSRAAAVAPPDPALRSVLERALAGDGEAPLRGAGAWLFHPDEARLLLAPRVAARPATAGSSVPASADPAEVIVDFRDQLRRSGRELLVVPVPAKLAVYPDRATGDESSSPGVRVDGAVVAFGSELARRGVHVLDLLPDFLEARRSDPEPLYPETNAHWGSRAIEIAARRVAREIRDLLDLAPPRALAPLAEGWSDERSDLAVAPPGEPRPRERVRLRVVPDEPSLDPVDDDGRGPVLLLGDSNLAFLTPRRSGFPHLLGRELGFATPQIVVNAGGPTGARQRLARLPHRLAGKRLVVWVFASRQLVAGPAWEAVELPPLPALDSAGAS
jgi:hypothetical protein